jgi:MoaA/NifB/PqqE/SkfB family radical SAM enzyme
MTSNVFNYNHIDEYQIEITTYCNAACPQCPRNDLGIGINPYMPLVHLPRSVIDTAFPAELCQRLRMIFFCGSYGDPTMHPEFLDILRDFRKKHSTLWLYIHTNGGVHDASYWQEIAAIMNGYGQIDFGIDGLDDTLGLYRKNVAYHKVINNASAFIQAGGRAKWNYIVFKHNEHQVDQARDISQQLGFAEFLVRSTGRFFNHHDMVEMPSWPVQQQDYVLEPPTDTQYRNNSMMFLPKLKKQYAVIKDYFDTTEIKCDALLGRKVAINAEGTVLPCNFFNHNLYDARFHNESLPGANKLSSVNGQNQVRHFLSKYGLDNLNIRNNSLAGIFDNPMWDDLVSSWGDGSRLFECAMTCGSKLKKVWDQGGSKR